MTAQCVVQRFSPEAARRGGATRKEAAKRSLCERIKAGNPTVSARPAITRWAREDGITAEEWCQARGIELPATDPRVYDARQFRATRGSTGGNLEKTVQEACQMLGEDGRWVVIGLLAIAGRLPSPKGAW